VLVPWERYQDLLSLEKRDLKHTTEVKRTEAFCASVTAGDCTVLACPADIASQQELGKKEQQDIREGWKKKQQQQQGFGETVRSIDEKELALLRPPGIPVKKWLTWK